MKKCHFCAEEIQDDAIKCRYCGEFLTNLTLPRVDSKGSGLSEKPGQKWYFRISVLVIAFLCVGPIALPLVWINPRFSRASKIIISLMVIILSYCLWVLFMKSLRSMEEYYDFLKQLY